MRVKVGLLLAVLCLSAAPLFAHHSFRAQFDSNKPIQLMGTVTKVEWTNPHARFYLAVKNYDDTTTNWNFELGSPLQLHRQGWRADSLKVGDKITVDAYLARDGSKMASARKITMADGRSVFGGSPIDEEPTP